jgi:hypothetical protein
MAVLKYQNNILTDIKLPELQRQRGEVYAPRATRILWLESFVIQGAPSVILSWYWKATEKESTPPHTHDFEEVLGFIGADPQNPEELYGEVEFWMEDEGNGTRPSADEGRPWGNTDQPQMGRNI